MLAPRYQLPRMIEQSKAQTLSFPLYEAGLRVAPSSGVFNLYRPGGDLALTQTVTNLGSNDVLLVPADTSSEERGEHWLEEWVLTVAGEVITFRREAALVRRVLYSTISDDDLERVHPGLSAYLPSSQTTWEWQREEAFSQLQARLLGAGNRPNLIIGSWALRNVHLYWTLFLIADLLRMESSGRWAKLAEDWGSRVEREWSALQFQYDDDDDGTADGEEAAVPTLLLSDLPGDIFPDDWSF
jgi:hypothetical protein